MTTTGTVRTWYAEEGWGVIDSPDTPGGCRAHFSHVAMPGIRSLTAGQRVKLEWEPTDQDGYTFCALRLWPHGQDPYQRPVDTTPSDAYRSRLTLTFDDEQA